MAAHIVTALNQLTDDIDQNRVNWDHLDAALKLSSWTEDLNLDDYISLRNVVDSGQEKPKAADPIKRLSAWIENVYPKYLSIWQKLGNPRTREDWHKAKYS